MVIQFFRFLLNQFPDQFLFVDLVLHLRLVLVHLLLHHEHGLMGTVLDELILYVFEHHIESILHVVLRPPRHFFDYFRPLVADAQSLLQYQYIFLQTEWLFLDLWVQEVDPALSALLAVSRHVQIDVQLVCNLTPLLCSLFSDETDQLFVLSLDPVALLYRRLLVLVELVLALRVVSARNEARYLYPVVLVQLLRCYTFTSAVFLYCPLE